MGAGLSPKALRIFSTQCIPSLPSAIPTKHTRCVPTNANPQLMCASAHLLSDHNAPPHLQSNALVPPSALQVLGHPPGMDPKPSTMPSHPREVHNTLGLDFSTGKGKHGYACGGNWVYCSESPCSGECRPCLISAFWSITVFGGGNTCASIYTGGARCSRGGIWVSRSHRVAYMRSWSAETRRQIIKHRCLMLDVCRNTGRNSSFDTRPDHVVPRTRMWKKCQNWYDPSVCS